MPKKSLANVDRDLWRQLDLMVTDLAWVFNKLPSIGSFDLLEMAAKFP